ncbi:MAG: type II/IV secretion system protein [Planctomycetes bacterium]|nr:type II/IV secretion system protein [Planctomycetota bacterium]
MIPRPLAEKLNALALFRVRDTLVVATEEPQDLDMIDQIEHLTGLTVRPVFAFSASIQRMQRRAYEEDFRVDAITADLDESAVELQVEASDVDIASVHDLVDGSPVINLVNYLVLQAIRKMASDIHIEPSRKFGTVRFRIDGQLVEMLRPRRDIFPAIVSRIKVMARLDIAEQRVPQDGRCQVIADGKEVDLRVSTLPTVLGEKVVIRVLDKQRLTFNLDELGIPPDTLGIFKGLLKKPYGLILVTGPTGSGKTTTLYSALELIKSVNRNIVTVEDPVEYQIELVNQVQADPARGVSFASALRSILRQDPDVIMVGEIRDAETAQVAVQAALTGHLVLSTLHTNDSVSAITRMMDMGIESYKLAAALIGVVAQRLVRTICPNCQTTYYPRAEFLEALHYQGDMRRSFAKGEGCRECFDSGFKGRTGIYEVLPVTADVRRMIADQAPLETVREWFTQQRFPSLLECGLHLAEQEVSSLEEVARIAFVE